MKIKGTVLEIVFLNEENGYTVLDLDADGRLVTAVGIFPLVNAGEVLSLTGEFRENARFGEQFVVSEVEITKPTDVIGIYKYLCSGLFRGVGEKTAQQIVSYFGDKALEIIEKEPQKLLQIEGIGKKKLADIIDGYKDTLDMQQSILFLQKFDISMGLALKIYRFYGDTTIASIKDNPYSLVEDIDGVGFLTADKIAEKVGISKESVFRIQAAFYHVLRESGGRSGHTCLPQNLLIDETAKLVGITDTDRLTDALHTMTNVKFVTVDGSVCVAPGVNYNTEKSIADRVLLLNKNCDEWDIDVEDELSNYEATASIKLHEHQKEAIKSVFNNGVSIITGGPGTGKTTIIKGITSILKARKKNVILCAPTGRASKRMSEATGEEAFTLHRLLKIDFECKETCMYNAANPLEADAVIVDEISMADIFIFNSLVKALPNGARLVLVGDKDQLPSVSCGNILSDLIQSNCINVVYLTEIYRQAKDSMIVVNAHRINGGFYPETKGASDFFINNKTDPYDIQNAVISMTKTRIPSFLNLTSRDVQVLSPMKKGVVGVENMNKVLQSALNPDGKIFKHGETVFKQGDKVMQTVNNYCLEWIRQSDGERGEGVFNGDIGYIAETADNGVTVLFEDGKAVVYTGGELDELTLAYCVSVHKSQGCEFPVVIMVVANGNYMILTRNLLYTAVTRAKKMVVIVGDEANVRKMVNNDYTAKRYSLLKHFLHAEDEKVKRLWGFDE